MPIPDAPTPANRLLLDYRSEASKFMDFGGKIVDAHAHINGERACRVWLEAADLYGIGAVYTQTRLDDAPAVREALGDRARFVAIPDYMAEDKKHAFTTGFTDAMQIWHDEYGARMVKFWMAPRLRDFTEDPDLGGLYTFDSDLRRSQMDRAAEVGLNFMAHIADPDTWFATKYADASVYGTKAQQYESLERAIEAYSPTHWLLAHMGGSPEDLEFLSGLLDRHANIVIDTSACKWQVRELSKHEPDVFKAFLDRYAGRVLFGSDIVSTDEHLAPSPEPEPGSKRPNFGVQAQSPEQAFDLYASRYWAMRTMFETDYDGQSPIADPDLMMVDPENHDEMSAPRLRGHNLGRERLQTLYIDAVSQSLDKWYGLSS